MSRRADAFRDSARSLKIDSITLSEKLRTENQSFPARGRAAAQVRAEPVRIASVAVCVEDLGDTTGLLYGIVSPVLEKCDRLKRDLFLRDTDQLGKGTHCFADRKIVTLLNGGQIQCDNKSSNRNLTRTEKSILPNEK